MNRLKESLAAYWKASEELENAALLAMTDPRSQLSLTDSRLLRDRTLDGELRGARAERYIMSIPVGHQVAK
jgi:hypothetical protein